MGIILPAKMIDPKDYVAKLQSLAAKALEVGKSVIDVKEVVIRPLRPADLGLTTNEWTFNISSGENVVINKTLDDKTLVMIVGIFNLSSTPATTEVIFGTQAKTVEDVYIEDMYLYDIKEAILDEAVVYQPGSTVLIKAVAKAANTAEKLGFLGFVVEPAGRRIGSS